MSVFAGQPTCAAAIMSDRSGLGPPNSATAQRIEPLLDAFASVGRTVFFGALATRPHVDAHIAGMSEVVELAGKPTDAPTAQDPVSVAGVML